MRSAQAPMIAATAGVRVGWDGMAARDGGTGLGTGTPRSIQRKEIGS